MMLKIMTAINTTKIINDIQDVEINNSAFDVVTWQDIYSLDIPPVRHNNKIEIESYDWEPVKTCTHPEPASTPIYNIPSGNPIPATVRIVDYLKGGEWHRVAIMGYAYYCNDDGKTVAKIGC